MMFTIAISLVLLTSPEAYQWPSIYHWPQPQILLPEEPTNHLVIFTAIEGGWCPACTRLESQVGLLKKNGWRVSNYPDMTGQIVIFDIDANAQNGKALFQRFDIKSVPTLVKFNHGKPTARVTGYQDVWQIGTLIKGRPVTPTNP